MKYKLFLILGIIFLFANINAVPIVTLISPANNSNIITYPNFVAIYNITEVNWDNIVYYRMNETSGTTVDDITSNDYNGNCINCEGNEWNATGKIGGALQFDKTSDATEYIRVDDNANLDNTKTISFWFMSLDTTSAVGTKILISKGNQSDAIYGGLIWEDDSQTIGMYYQNGTGVNFLKTGALGDYQWYHLVLTTNGLNRTLYINGYQNISGNDAYTNPYNNAYNISIGGMAGASRTMSGLFDEVGIWDRVLTPSEIYELYNSGIGGTYPLSLGNPYAYNWTNATYYLWFNNGTVYNTSSQIILGIDNITSYNFTSIPVEQNAKWNVYGCYENTTLSNCIFSANNYTFSYGYIINSQTYSSSITETLSNSFNINVTLASGISLTSANLNYNGTLYGGSITSSGTNRIINSTFTTPSVSANVNVSFFWEFTFSDGISSYYQNTTSANQTIQTLEIDNCAVNTHLILNYTIKDEDTRAFLLNSTWNTTSNVYVKLSGDFSGTVYTYYSASTVTNPIPICVENAILVGENYRLDAILQFGAGDHVTEYYYIENYSLNTSSAPINLSVYDLATANSQEFLITYKDENFLAVQGAIIEITRQYLELGQFLTIESIKTDNDGRSIAHLVLNDEVYTIYVKVEGELTATYQNVRAFCTDVATGNCYINLNAQGTTSQPSSFINLDGISYTPNYNDTTKTFTFSFTTIDGSSKTVILNITKYDNYLNDTFCTTSLLSSSGTLTCIIPPAYYNSSALVEVHVLGGSLLMSSIIDISSEDTDVLNPIIYILAFIIVITLPLLGITSGAMTLMFFFVGLIAVSLLSLINLGGFIGYTSAFLWILVAGVILLIKATRRNQ